MTSSLTAESPLPPGPAADGARPVAPRRRGLRERLSLGHLFMIAAALLAFVLVVSLLQDRTETARILVADTDLVPGTVLTPSVVSEVEIPANSPLVGRVATLDSIAGGSVTAAQRIGAGDPITITALSPGANPSALRAMSLPIDRVDAVGGDLAPGDRVDVIGVDANGAAYVAVDLEVLDTQASESRNGALGTAALSTYYVTVAVDDQTALRLALALEADEVTVLRSTGAGEVPADQRQLREVEVAPSAATPEDEQRG